MKIHQNSTKITTNFCAVMHTYTQLCEILGTHYTVYSWQWNSVNAHLDQSRL